MVLVLYLWSARSLENALQTKFYFKSGMNFDLANSLWPMHRLSEITSPRASSQTEYGDEDETLTIVELSCRVLLFNDDHHTFDEVISQVCKATGCSGEKGESIAWEVHTMGKALVFEGDLIECLRVSSVLEEIALHTQVLT